MFGYLLHKAPFAGTPSTSGHAFLLTSQGPPSQRTPSFCCKNLAPWWRSSPAWVPQSHTTVNPNSGTWAWRGSISITLGKGNTRKMSFLLFLQERVTRLTFCKALWPVPRRPARSASPMDKGDPTWEWSSFLLLLNFPIYLQFYEWLFGDSVL